jgi:hypothetical protein
MRSNFILNSRDEVAQSAKRRVERRRLNWQQNRGFFLFSTASRPTLRPTQPPTQWAIRTLSQQHEDGHSFLTSTEVKNYTITPLPRVRGVIFCQ